MSTFAPLPYATLQTIKSSSWSLMLDSTAGLGSGSGIGKVVQAIDDVHQCLKIIFGTQPGEDPSRPTFGCDLTKYLDMPLPAAIPAIVAEVASAVGTWEPRVVVQSVSAAANLQVMGQLLVAIVWQPNLGLIGQQTSVVGIPPQTTTIAVGGIQ